MNATQPANKFPIPAPPNPAIAESNITSMCSEMTQKAENVEELHFIMVKLHQSVRNSVEKIERKHSVLMLEDDSTLKKF